MTEQCPDYTDRQCDSDGKEDRAPNIGSQALRLGRRVNKVILQFIVIDQPLVLEWPFGFELVQRQLTREHHEIHREALRAQVRVEEMEYALKQQQQNAADLEGKREEKLNLMAERVDENSERLNRMDQYLNLESTKKRTAVVAPAPSAKKSASEDDMYRSAKQAFDQGELDAARQGFQEFIKRYPNSKNADNAQFWIGEIYYREKWYEKAILEYQSVIEKYPKGNKAPAALLKQGLAFSNIGDTANAKLILEELGRKYPKSNEAKVGAEKLKTMK